MPAISDEIPILTVPTVLFPGTFLPVQVTDDAQRKLLRDCLSAGRRLGVILSPDARHASRSSIPFTTGCLASVTLLAHSGDENSEEPLQAMLFGKQRMRVLDLLQQKPYLTGRIEQLDDQHGANIARRTEQVARIFAQYLAVIGEYYDTEVDDITLPHDPTMASYMLASVLYLPAVLKQRWLESASTALRLDEEQRYLAMECEKHTALLRLSQYADQRFSPPDHRLYLTLTSQN
ncbi:MAG TPA: LON peptidase substrate-binding domain-containing protein [Armatimonadota bacterium]